MNPNSLPFLQRIAQEWAATTPVDSWHQTAWVLPSRRAERFLRTYLSQAAPGPAIAPLTLPLDALLTSLSGLRPLGNLDALLRFYAVYAERMESHAEPFESFAQWGAGVLRDINEIDRQGADPALVWRATAEWDALERWGRGDDDAPHRRTAMLRVLPELHLLWHEAQRRDGVGMSGLIMRTASPPSQGPSPDQWKTVSDEWGVDRWVFAGFNALTPCEEALFRWAIQEQGAHVRFDADDHYLNDDFHEAGLYLRTFRSTWPAAAVTDLQNPGNALRTGQKSWSIQGVSGPVGMAKAAGNWVLERSATDQNLERTALVLADESLLLPVLHALPDLDVNVTMGLPLASVPLTASLEALLEIQETASGALLALRPLQGFLDHPNASLWLGSEAPVALNRFHQKQTKLHQTQWSVAQLLDSSALGDLPGLELLEPTDDLEKWLLRAAERLEAGSAHAFLRDWERSAAQSLASVVRSLAERLAVHSLRPTWRAVRLLLQSHFREEPLDLLGEPLAGLQIMGLLETRLLDFEAVLVVGANEGVLPPARGDLGWIPWSVRSDLGLPMPHEREAINAYHFYRLLQRPQHIRLIYNTDADATGGGEPSRYLHQLRIELKPHSPQSWTHDFRFVPLGPNSMVRPAVWSPSPEALETLETRFASPKTALSPSKLSQFLRDPEAFYREYLLQIRPEDEPKERMDDALFGNLVHKTHELAYQAFEAAPVPQTLRPTDAQWAAWMAESLQEEYPGGQVETGKNALAYGVGSTLLRELLSAEADRIQEAQERGEMWSLAGVEVSLAAALETSRGPVYFKGKADRLERTPEGLSILDLKTGKVDASQLAVSDWQALFVPDKGSKALQLMTYAWMYRKQFPDSDEPIRAGIQSLRTPRAEPIWLTIQGNSSLGGAEIDAFEQEVLLPLVAVMRGEISASEWAASGEAQRLADAE